MESTGWLLQLSGQPVQGCVHLRWGIPAGDQREPDIPQIAAGKRSVRGQPGHRTVVEIGPHSPEPTSSGEHHETHHYHHQ